MSQTPGRDDENPQVAALRREIERLRAGPSVNPAPGGPHEKLYKERMALATRQQAGHIRYDPIEDDPAIGSIIRYVDRVVEERQRYRGRRPRRKFGSIHGVWRMKQEILLHEYGIVWFTPAQMSPWMCYD